MTRIALLKYLLQLPGFELPEAVRVALQEFDDDLAKMLEDNRSPSRPCYLPLWTYRDLKRLGDKFRTQAREKYGMPDFKFGTLI